MKINTNQLNKEIRQGLIRKIQGILTPEEFIKVEFDPIKPEWKAPEDIQRKITEKLK